VSRDPPPDFDRSGPAYGQRIHPWVQPGSGVRVVDAPTAFGPVSMELTAAAENRGAWSLHLSNRFRCAPQSLVLRVPWFLRCPVVQAEGKSVPVDGGEVRLPSDTRSVTVTGEFIREEKQLSFAQTVEDYKREYRRRYERFLETGCAE